MQMSLSPFELILLPIFQLRIHKTFFSLSYDTSILYSFIDRDLFHLETTATTTTKKTNKQTNNLRNPQVNDVFTE